MYCIKSVRSTLKTILIPCVILIMIASCKKGDTGPAGPPGTANVIYSDWFTPKPYTKDTVFGIWGFYWFQNAPEITQSVLDSGTVLVFGKLLGYNPSVWAPGTVGQLPIIVQYQQGGWQQDTWQARAYPGRLRIRFENNNNIYTSISDLHQFRYIILPGGKKAAASSGLSAVRTGQSTTIREIAENYDKMSYEEICQKLNLTQ